MNRVIRSDEDPEVVFDRRRLIWMVSGGLAGLLGMTRFGSVAVAQESVPEFSSGRYFAETGHNLREPFLSRWIAAGGERSIGIPLSEERYDADLGVVQSFTGMTMVYDPGLAFPWDVQGARIEADAVRAIAPASATRKVAGCKPDAFFCQYFDETGHTVSGGIASFWSLYGELPLFGLPLSEPFRKSGDTFDTQLFEKAVLEDRGQDDVRLRPIGLEQAETAGLLFDPAFLPAPPTGGETFLVSAEDGLRLRSAPGLDSDIVVVLSDSAEFITERGAKGEWIPGYADGFSGWVSKSFLQPAPPLPKVSTDNWNPAVWQGASLGETNVRSAPSTTAPIASELVFGDQVEVSQWVKGEEVFPGASLWAETTAQGFVYARNVGRTGPVAAPPLPPESPVSGAWIDANLTQQLLVAYEDRVVKRVAVMTSGMAGWETPPGLYSILVRVPNETMNSGAIGAESFYKLEDVLFTQYFSDLGHAIHYAWWRTPETIGRPGSHGCLNLLLDDSRYFWEWAGIGTPVFVHY